MMSRLLVAAFGVLLVASVGCESTSSKTAGDDAKMMSADACPHCAGVQKATADGKCAVCEAKKSSKASADGMGASADVCTTCAGMQTATADGKCSACDAEVAAK